MLLTFRKQFELYVWEGSKVHSIRSPRKNWPPDWQPKPGEEAACYGDARQKTMHLLGRFPMKPCQHIDIRAAGQRGLLIAIDETPLCEDETEAFCRADGFRPRSVTHFDPRPSEVMRRFWEVTHDLSAKPFSGVLLYWAYRAGTTEWSPPSV